MTRRTGRVRLLTEYLAIRAVIDHLGMPGLDPRRITGIAVIPRRGGFSDVWVTDCRQPFDPEALFDPLVTDSRPTPPLDRMLRTIGGIEHAASPQALKK